MQRSNVHQLYDLSCVLAFENAQVAGIRNKLDFSITVITTWIHLVGRKRRGKEGEGFRLSRKLKKGGGNDKRLG